MNNDGTLFKCIKRSKAATKGQISARKIDEYY